MPVNSAYALDAADGVIDGRYFGRQIVPTAAGVSTGYYGYGAAPGVASVNPALALDAADGVIDGRFYGQPIFQTAQTGPMFQTQTYGNVGPAGTVAAAAAALDASDGVVDGRFFGTNLPGQQMSFP